MQSLELQSSLVAALGNLVLGLAVFLRSPRSAIHRAFGLLSLTIAVWNAGDFVYGLAWGSSPSWLLAWHRLTFAGSMAIPPAAFHFVRRLTRRGRDWTRRYQQVLIAEFAVMLALLWTPLFPGTYQVIAAAYQFSNLTLCLVLLVLRLRPASPLEKLQLKYLIWGGFLATLLGMTEYMALGSPSVPRLGAPAILLYLCLVSAAIGRHGLFSAGRIFGRWVVVLVVAFGFAALSQVVRSFQPPGLLFECLTPLLVALLAVALYDPLREAFRLRESRSQRAFQDLADRITAVGRSLVFSPHPERWQETLLEGLRALPEVESAECIALTDPEGRPLPSTGRGAALVQPAEGEPRAGGDPLRGLLPRLDGRSHNLVIPVEDQERLHAALLVTVRKPHLYLEPEHLDLLTLLGTQAGLVAQAVERLRWMKRQEELAALAALAAGAAHEIKNPLGAIRGAVDLLSEKPGDDPGRFLGIIREEVDRLDRFLGDFLTYGKPGRLDLETLDVAALAREAAQALSLQAGAPPVSVEGAGDAWVRGDRLRLRQVLLNLLLNAAQAAGIRGRIEVRVERESGGVSVRVRDSGPGIDPGVLPRLFRPFFTTRRDGTGLGLAICSRIVDLHGGRISAANWSEVGGAGGAEFVLRLPASPPEPGREAAVEGEP